MMESCPGLMFHIPKVTRNTVTIKTRVVNPIKPNGMCQSDGYSGAKFNNLSVDAIVNMWKFINSYNRGYVSILEIGYLTILLNISALKDDNHQIKLWKFNPRHLGL